MRGRPLISAPLNREQRVALVGICPQERKIHRCRSVFRMDRPAVCARWRKGEK